MARRNPTDEVTEENTITETPEEAVVDSTTEEVVEATDSTTPESAPEAPAAEPTEPATEAPAPAATEEVDFTEFSAAAEAAVAQRDEATGELPLVAIEPVVVLYRALPTVKAKNAAKKILEAGVKAGMDALNIQQARAWMQLNDSMTSAKPEKAAKESAEKTPVDPSLAYVDRLASIRLALDLALGNAPEGVDADAAVEKVKALVGDTSGQAATYLAWLTNEAEDKGDEPDVSQVAKAAARLSLGKGGGLKAPKSSGGDRKVFEGERRDIGKHIAEAFAGVESGTFLKISEIRSFKSEEYGDDAPSAGAINNRLFPAKGECNIEGITPGMVDGKRGATKA